MLFHDNFNNYDENNWKSHIFLFKKKSEKKRMIESARYFW